MKQKIEAILARELAKLDKLSTESADPLSPAEVKSLDTLIRAWRTFSSPSSDPPKQETPQETPLEELLSDLKVGTAEN